MISPRPSDISHLPKDPFTDPTLASPELATVAQWITQWLSQVDPRTNFSHYTVPAVAINITITRGHQAHKMRADLAQSHARILTINRLSEDDQVEMKKDLVIVVELQDGFEAILAAAETNLVTPLVPSFFRFSVNSLGRSIKDFLIYRLFQHHTPSKRCSRVYIIRRILDQWIPS